MHRIFLVINLQLLFSRRYFCNGICIRWDRRRKCDAIVGRDKIINQLTYNTIDYKNRKIISSRCKWIDNEFGMGAARGEEKIRVQMSEDVRKLATCRRLPQLTLIGLCGPHPRDGCYVSTIYSNPGLNSTIHSNLAKIKSRIHCTYLSIFGN